MRHAVFERSARSRYLWPTDPFRRDAARWTQRSIWALGGGPAIVGGEQVSVPKWRPGFPSRRETRACVLSDGGSIASRRCALRSFFLGGWRWSVAARLRRLRGGRRVFVYLTGGRWGRGVGGNIYLSFADDGPGCFVIEARQLFLCNIPVDSRR